MGATVEENSIAGTIVIETGAEYVDKGDAGFIDYRVVSGTDGSTDMFDILEDGTVVVKNGDELDFETLSKSLKLCFYLILEAKDRGIVGSEYGGGYSTPLSDESELKVCVTDKPEPPTFPVPEYAFTVTVDSRENQNVGIPIEVEDQDFGDIVSLSINTDPFDNGNDTIYPNRPNGDSTGTGGVFGIDSSGQLFLRVHGVITEGDIMVLPIEAEDSYGLTASASVTVEILPPANYPPSLNDTVRYIPENALSGPVGPPLNCHDDAKDYGKNQVLTYTIVEGNSDGWFDINPASGQITVTGNANLNFENKNDHYITVECKDNGLGELSDTAKITIFVQDLNEGPVVADRLRSDFVFEV